MISQKAGIKQKPKFKTSSISDLGLLPPEVSELSSVVLLLCLPATMLPTVMAMDSPSETLSLPLNAF